ncbi:oxidoreductase [Actinomadura rubrobrunea]|uniref:Oxidoreductase n=1 Tax=Actinomadura rubrobrunea TaxID=115335 RepID=A0A9W6PVT7_9ACTN|nr:oxidoreductase [Actinomadura rubrobrunea]GLW63921.1 oxidoreductase [Actinomadura rubrobrunea]
MARKWTPADIPDLSGRTAIVTGANKNLGFYTALELARHGAEVTLACRRRERGERALKEIRRRAPDASVRLGLLDLADLSTVERFAEEYAAEHDALDILVNNAGILGIPRLLTADGHEMQFGVNYLGHFALTGRLLPLLTARPGARVVNLSTWVVRFMGSIDLDDLQGERHYHKFNAYNQAKLANLVFTRELARRYGRRGPIGVAAHPGFAVSDLQYTGPRMEGSRFQEAFFRVPTRLFAKPTAVGAWPSLYAACAPDVEPGACYAPTGPGQIWGRVGRVKTPAKIDDPELGRRLWDISERLTGVSYEAAAVSRTKGR